MVLVLIYPVVLKANKLLKYTNLVNLDSTWLAELMSEQPKLKVVSDLNRDQPKFV